MFHDTKPDSICRRVFFCLSALTFLCMECPGYLPRLTVNLWSLRCAFAVIVLLAFQSNVAHTAPTHKIFLALTTAGICLCALKTFQRNLGNFLKADLFARLKIAPEAVQEKIAFLPFLMALAGAFSVYCCLSLFFRKLQENAHPAQIMRKLSIGEKALYGLLILSVFALIAYVFLTFPDSYLAEVHSSDAHNLFKVNNAFLCLTNAENDLRQPLFALFSAPFNGAAYALAHLFPGLPMQPVFMNWAQYLMVFFANILLTEMMGLHAPERICFLLLVALAYPYISCGLIVEQYMTAYFYLILAFYALSRQRKCNPFVFCGASGSLITGIALAPFFSDVSPLRNLKKWLSDMWRLALSFVVLFIASFQMTHAFLLFDEAAKFSSFARGVSFGQRFLQYANFISSCLISPADEEIVFTSSCFSLAPVERLNFFGVSALALLCVSFLWNHRDFACRCAFGWIAFSALILLGFGWGSVENIMPLYGLYFSWACLTLLFRLFQNIAETLRRKWILPVCCAAAGLFLLYRNIRGVGLLMRFFAQFTLEERWRGAL